MLNIDDFIKRLEVLLDYYNLSASVFADKLGVQRSGLSHLLSGRNKPSLDFVMKITESFPDVDLYWLLDGRGTFPKTDNPGGSIIPPSLPPPATKEKLVQDVPNLFSGTENVLSQDLQDQENNIDSDRYAGTGGASEIERIVVFYKNGTFKNYNPGK